MKAKIDSRLKTKKHAIFTECFAKFSKKMITIIHIASYKHTYLVKYFCYRQNKKHVLQPHLQISFNYASPIHTTPPNFDALLG